MKGRCGLLVVGCLAVLALGACTRTIDRTRWETMSHGDRVLYVSSLIGAEKVKDAKGGGGRDYRRRPDEYVRLIDAAYARGDGRDAHAIFSELAP